MGSVKTAADAPCRSGDTAAEPADLPRPRQVELDVLDSACDPAPFMKDFVPLTPLRVNVKNLEFEITPAENPGYAFGENREQSLPGITVRFTLEMNPERSGSADNLGSLEFEEKIEAGLVTQIPAPLHVQ